MKISRFGSRVGCAFRKASRAAATSSRSCSARGHSFFKWQLEVAEEAKDRRLADLYLFLRQASLKLHQCAIRLFRHELLDQISVRCKRKCLVAAEFGRADTARFALTPDEPANGA